MIKNILRVPFILSSLGLVLSGSQKKNSSTASFGHFASSSTIRYYSNDRIEDFETIFPNSQVSLKLSVKNSDKFNYSTKGLTITDFKATNEFLFIDATIELAEATLSILRNDNSTLSTFYFYRDSLGRVSCSSLSLDTAKKAIGIPSKILFSGTNTVAGFKPIIIGPISPIKSKSLSSTFSWKDSKGTEFPLTGVTVTLTTDSGKSITKNTDKTGTALFEFSLSNGSGLPSIGNNTNDLDSIWNEIENRKYSISLSLSSKYINSIDSKGQRYAIEIPITLVSGNTEKTLNYCFTPSSDFGQMTEIYQSLYYYATHAAQTILPTNSFITLKQCSVQFPSSQTKTALYNKNTIYISNSPNNNTSLKSYESWDVFGHEYGHHLEHCRRFTNSIGGTHYASNDDCSYLLNFSKYTISDSPESVPRLNEEKAKQDGLRLAWAEGWPTFWATMAQESFPDELKKETYLSIGDNRYYASNYGIDKDGTFSFDEYMPEDENSGYINYLEDIQGGDGCELAIIRFLYHLWNSSKIGKDVFSISESSLRKVLTSMIGQDLAPDYFYEYLWELQMQFGFQEISELAECYHLCPCKAQLTTSGQSHLIKWKDIEKAQNMYQGHLVNNGFIRNNKFYIGIYDHAGGNPIKMLNSGNPIYPTTSGDNLNYKLTNDEANYIQVHPDYYVSITAYYKSTTGVQTELGPVYGPFAKLNR